MVPGEPEMVRIEKGDERIPPLLRAIPGFPATLWMRGNFPDPCRPYVAIVGTRKASAEGRLSARILAKTLADRGCVIVSGLALGIDAAAHEGALESTGATVAVLANGLDIVYPRSHEQLARRILERNGCLVSEYSPGTEPFPSNFLARNRIVSGLCVATVIIEAPEHSGTLTTARFALEQGREVLVFPGPARHPNFAGSHMLIRQGARLVASPEDVCEDLGIEEKPIREKFRAGENMPQEFATRIIATLTKADKALSIDMISETMNIPVTEVAGALSVLVIEGAVLETPQGFVLR
jgi:DNA processing protein